MYCVDGGREDIEGLGEDNIDEKESMLRSLLSPGMKILYKVSFPIKEKRSVDYIAMHQHDKIFLKIEKRISSKDRIFQELKRLSKALNVNALFIADRFNNEEILDDVLYIRDRVGVISRDTLDRVSRGKKIYIYEYSGMYYVKINGKKLQRLRIKMGYSLHELANAIGVSSKALQKYEEGEMDMSAEKAYRFIELFGEMFEDVVRGIDIFRDRIVKSESRAMALERLREVESDDKRYKLALKFSSFGINAEVFNAIPTDILLQSEDAKIFITYINSKYNEASIELKCKDNQFFAKTFNGIAISVIDSSHGREGISIAEDVGEVKVLSNVEDFVKELIKSLRR
jgi:putative transcriptional regulator